MLLSGRAFVIFSGVKDVTRSLVLNGERLLSGCSRRRLSAGIVLFVILVVFCRDVFSYLGGSR